MQNIKPTIYIYIYIYLQEIHFNIKTQKKDNTNQRKAGRTILISDKADFRERKLIRDKKEALQNYKNLSRPNNL